MFITSSSLTHKNSTKIGLQQVVQKIHSRTDPRICQKIYNQIFIFKKIFSPTKSTYLILKFDISYLNMYIKLGLRPIHKHLFKILIKIMQSKNVILRQFSKKNNNPWHKTWLWYHFWVFLGSMHQIQGGITLRKFNYMRSCHGLCLKF